MQQAAMARETLDAAARCQHVLQCLSAGLYCPLPRGYLDFSNHKEQGEEEEEEKWISDPSFASFVSPPKVTLQGWLDQLAEALKGDTLSAFGGTVNLSGHQQLGDKEILSLLQAIKASQSVTGLLLRDTSVGDNSVGLLSLILDEISSFSSLDLAGTQISEAGVVELCLAVRRHKGLRRLCLPSVSLVGLEAVVTLVRRNRTLEELEIAVHGSPPPLTAASDIGLVAPEERRGPPGGPPPPPPPQPKSSSKKKRRQMIRVPNEQEDETLSLTGEGDRETVESSSDTVECLLRRKYVEEVKGLLLKLFAAFEEARSLCLLSVGGVGDDPDLRRLVLAFDQLSSQRQLDKEKQLASEKEREADEQLAGSQKGGKRTCRHHLPRLELTLRPHRKTAGAAPAADAAADADAADAAVAAAVLGVPSPVPPRLYFSNMLEGPLTQAVVALAKAKADNPKAVDTDSKQLAFLAKQLYEAG